MKKNNLMGDVCSLVACNLGVGLLCGKEVSTFVGRQSNIVVFAVIFFVCLLVTKQFATNCNCTNIYDFCNCVTPKHANALNLAFVTCGYLCVVAQLSAVEQCARFYLAAPTLPIFAIATCFFAYLVLQRGLQFWKKLNVLSLILVAIFAITLLIVARLHPSASNFLPPIKPTQTAIYALFCVAMSVPITIKFSYKCTAKHNLLASIIAAVALSVLLAVLLPLCNFESALPLLQKTTYYWWLKLLALIVIFLTTTNSVVANSVALYHQIADVLPNKYWRCVAIYGLATLLSLFGLDVVIKYTYTTIAIVTFIVVILAAKILINASRKIQKEIRQGV